MESIIYSLNGIFPIFFIALLGYYLKQKKYITEDFNQRASDMLFKYFMPIMLFYKVSNSDFLGAVDFKMFVFVYSCTLFTVIFTWVVGSKFIKDKATLGSFVQGIYRNNYAIIAISLNVALFGEVAMTKSAFLLAIVVPLYNLLAVLILTVCSKDPTVKKEPKDIFIAIITNRIIIGIALGIVVSILKIQMPSFVDNAFSMLAGITAPLAILMIGASMDFGKLKGKIGLTVLASLSKTVFLPLVFTPIAYLIGYRGMDLGMIFLFLTTPSATNSYIMARSMKCDDELAGSIVMATTLFSFVTIFLGILILKALALI